MRKIIVGAQVSLDGVMQAPGGPTEDLPSREAQARLVGVTGEPYAFTMMPRRVGRLVVDTSRIGQSALGRVDFASTLSSRSGIGNGAGA